METVRFTVPGEPKGKARARTVRSKKGGTFSYTPEGTMLYENLIKCCYRQESNNIVPSGVYEKVPPFLLRTVLALAFPFGAPGTVNLTVSITVTR